MAALNADYYNMATGQPTGALIIDGKSYNPVNGRYYFGITEEGQAVISNSEDTAGLAYAVGGGTLLVKEGGGQRLQRGAQRDLHRYRHQSGWDSGLHGVLWPAVPCLLRVHPV